MKKMKFALVAILLVAVMISCNQASYKKMKGGLEYKIVGDGKGPKVAYGDVIKYYLIQKYKDSVLKDSRNQPPAYQPVDSMQLPKEYYQIFSEARAGDSIVMRVPVDSVMKGGMMPPQFKKGEYFFTVVKVIGIVKPSEAQADFNKELKKYQEQDSIRAITQLVKDDQVLKDYMTKNNITATKTPMGNYVEIQKQGSGPNAQPGQILTINYTGKLLNGKAFDSNTDSSFRHAQPYDIVLGTTPLIKGWDDGLKFFNKGSKGRLLIPSVFGYGQIGSQSGEIKPNESLVFDIEILDIKEVPQQTPASNIPRPDTAKPAVKAKKK